jgi:trehalose/maltose hydrolase-like predicted phosphorylase
MHAVLEPTQQPGWVLSHEGYSVLSESAVESRFALGNGFLGMRAARSVSRGPTCDPARLGIEGILGAHDHSL